MSIQLGETPITEIPSVEEQQITPVEEMSVTEMTISEPVSYEPQSVTTVSKGDKVKEFFKLNPEIMKEVEEKLLVIL